MAIEFFSVGDLVKLSEDLFYRYDKDESFRSAGSHSAYYAIGMKPWMLGIVVRVRDTDAYLIEPDVSMTHRFIYDVYWTGGIGFRREQHCDLYTISKV